MRTIGKIVCLVVGLGLISVPAWGLNSTDMSMDQSLNVAHGGNGPGPDGDGDGEGGGEWGPGDCLG